MIVALRTAGQHHEALAAAHTLLANCVAQALQPAAASVQLTIASIFQAAEQPTLALAYVLNALYHATALHLDVLAATAAVTLAEVKLAMTVDLASEATALVQVRPAPCPQQAGSCPTAFPQHTTPVVVIVQSACVDAGTLAADRGTGVAGAARTGTLPPRRCGAASDGRATTAGGAAAPRGGAHTLPALLRSR